MTGWILEGRYRVVFEWCILSRVACLSGSHRSTDGFGRSIDAVMKLTAATAALALLAGVASALAPSWACPSRPRVPSATTSFTP